MRYRLTFAAGLALGYVLGTRAGREQYEKIKQSVQDLAQNPAVRNTAESAAQQSRDLAGRAYHTVSGKVGERMPDAVTGRVRSMRERAHAGHSGHSGEDDWGTGAP
ncbi:hypothetical protein GCM10018793_61410 [Streptomyces sulfonofaciens]|uniref:YtxH domain-containing protein n=1 Tax=Streptomyces sulfonofaciens TaxID=68272 RepID=A0A919L8Y2_9ACTN|nr:YtxH domain-containing protein [Streptomyces sulfonofaciens]GHH87071.1 hypothetical protein GCM10018793_61410 [Streptomyces sulfonofaciens]